MNSDTHFENERECRGREETRKSGGRCDGSRNRYQPGVLDSKEKKGMNNEENESEKEREREKERNSGKVRW